MLATILQFFAGLSLLIILHEFGHFICARMFGVRVIKFYLFFDFLFPFPGIANFSLFKKQVGDTEYGLGWFPFGGYVQMAGIMDESMDKDALKEPAKPDEFRAKPAWQRLIILLGGIVMNILVAFVLYSILAFGWGDEYIAVEDQKYGIFPDQYAQEAGLQLGDLITHVEGKKIKKAKDAKMDMIFDLAENVTVLRDGKSVEINNIPKELYKMVLDSGGAIGLFETALIPYIDTILPESAMSSADAQKGDLIISFDGQPVTYHQELSLLKQNRGNEEVTFGVLRGNDTIWNTITLDEGGMMGFVPDPSVSVNVTKRSYNFFQAIAAGPVKTWQAFMFYTRQFKLMFDPIVQGYKQIGGFGTIAKLYSGGFSWVAFLSTTAFLSIVLAFMNLLPIPALDGGHALFTIYEMIFRRPPNEKFMEYAQIGGMIFLFGLLILANGNDLFKYIMETFF